MNDLERSIIATLSYYAAFGRPLTLMELSQRLIPAYRLGGQRDMTIQISGLLERLNVLVSIGTVVQDKGFYALKGAADDFAVSRIEQEKIWAQKWRRMLKKAFWLQVVPYVKVLCSGGSMALGSTSMASDWDVFVVARADRLYTVRFGLLAVAWLMRALRQKHDQDVSDKFCFNHYVTTDGLVMSHHSIYTAHAISFMIPILEREDYWHRFLQANHWVEDYHVPTPQAILAHRSIARSYMVNIVRRAMEFVLGTYLGRALESLLRRWQQRRIKREPMTRERGGRVIATQQELEFHPRSFESVALRRYNAALEHHGLAAYVEHDSGLT